MSAYFDQLSRASFNGVEFAWDAVSIRSSLRKHVHTYRKTAGGALEKNGRGEYYFRFSCVFDESLSRLKRPYKNNYPEAMYALRTMYENEETHTLAVPTMGVIAACISEWEQDASPERNRNGERANIVFVEDQSSRFLVDSLVVDLDATGLDASMTSLIDTATRLNVPLNVFDTIQESVDGVLAIRDQAELYTGLVAAKVLALADLLREADRTIDQFKDPTNHELLQALKVLWWEANELAQNVRERQVSIGEATTPSRVMSVQEVSQYLFGRTDKVFDLLSLNTFTDALAIPGGTTVRYYIESDPTF